MRIINSLNAKLPKTVAGGAITTAQIFADGTSALVLPVPGSGRLEQRQFVVRASGYIVTGATTNVTLTLYSGSSLTAASNTVLLASTATAQNTATAPFLLEARLVCESVGGAGMGWVMFLLNGTVIGPTTFSTALSSLNMATEPAIKLALGVTFSSGHAGNKGYLNEFCLGF